MFKKITAVLLASSILLLPFTAGLADASGVRRRASIDYGEAIKTARETMWKSIAGGFCSGATVAVADEGKIVYAEGFGAADRAANRPVNAETRFNVGSTSKMFAAVGILLLVDDGKVRLDDPVAKYLPEFRMKDPRYKDITVRMLFNHSSGLPGSHFYFGYAVDENMHRYLID
ncbi:MAG TPA: serine hydrolase domain-containing protein, partial [Candidatus Wallbacteria bacterium]|nr:serine hydrolase domain-containing protein [Candidatus Wallbacteria bacterium]